MILRQLLCVAACLPAILAAQDAPRGKARVKRPNFSPALNLLPEGSTLKGVRIPRFDQDKRPSALLRAGLLRVVTDDKVTGEDIDLFIFAPTGAERLRVHMGTADYTASRGILKARDVLTLKGEGFSAAGNGGIFQLDSRRGFLHGPVTNHFMIDAGKVLSEAPPDVLQSILAMASLLVSAPEPLTPAQLRRNAEDSRSNAARIDAEVAPTREMITRNDQLSQAASLGFQAFANEIRRPGLIALAATGDEETKAPERNPDGIYVTCDGGMYFDAEKGHIVYLKNIKVTSPDFTFHCRGELKIILEKTVAEPEPAGEDPGKEEGRKDLIGPESFGDVQNIIATGGVRVIRRDAKGKEVTASADTTSYDARNGDIVLRGGFPTVVQGKNFMRALEPGLYIRLYANGSAYTQPGKWETGIANIKDLQKRK